MTSRLGKPVIGVVCDVFRGSKHVAHSAQEKYLEAVSAGADALVVLLPALIERPGAAWSDEGDLEAVLDVLDGVFLTGATSNVAPERYGAASADPDSLRDPERDHVSLGLIQRAVARAMPVMGVCRGFQEINVALGGTLHQAVHEVAGLADHRENPSLPIDGQYSTAHTVRFAPDGLLHRITGAAGTDVNSLHGQGVAMLAAGLAAEAVAPDGLVEAFSGRSDGFLLGAQWHPEWRFREDRVSTALFAAFGAAARAYRSARLGDVEPARTLAAAE